MSSSSSISATKLGLLIPQLMKNIEHSLLECDEKMKIETENLEEKVNLMQRNEGLAEIEKLKVEEKLQRSEKKCDELKETINRVIEESSAKDRLISELNEEINQLKKKNLEHEQLVGVYQEKLNCLLMKISKEIEDLTPEKLSANRKMEDLSGKQFEADQYVVKATPNIDEFMQKNLGSASYKEQHVYKMAEMYNEMSAHNSKMYTEIVKLREENEDLRQKKMESDKKCEVYKRQLAELAPRIMKVEEAFASGLNVKVEDLKNILAAIEKLPPASASNCDDENVAVLSKKGGRNWDCSKAQNIESSKELEGCSAKPHAGFPGQEDIIEINDSDNETNPIGPARTSDTVIIGANAAVKNEIIIEKSAQNSQSISKEDSLQIADDPEDAAPLISKKRAVTARSDAAPPSAKRVSSSNQHTAKLTVPLPVSLMAPRPESNDLVEFIQSMRTSADQAVVAKLTHEELHKRGCAALAYLMGSFANGANPAFDSHKDVAIARLQAELKKAAEEKARAEQAAFRSFPVSAEGRALFDKHRRAVVEAYCNSNIFLEEDVQPYIEFAVAHIIRLAQEDVTASGSTQILNVSSILSRLPDDQFPSCWKGDPELPASTAWWLAPLEQVLRPYSQAASSP